MEINYYNVGKIVNTHGVKGEVRVISTTDFDERFEPGQTLYFFKDENAEPTAYTIASHRRHKQFELLTFEGLTSIDDVLPLKGGVLKVSEDDQHELEEGEFYYHEIIGCEVYLTDGKYVGSIKEIIDTGANDVWVVERTNEKDALIPYIDEVVKSIDIDEQKILIEPMEGLL